MMTPLVRRNLTGPRTERNPDGVVSLPGDEYDLLFRSYEGLLAIRDRAGTNFGSEVVVEDELRDGHYVTLHEFIDAILREKR